MTFEYEAAENVFTGVNVGGVIEGIEGCPRIGQYRRITTSLEQSVSGKAWRVKSVSGPGGATLAYEYDENGNLTAVKRSGSDAISQPTGLSEWAYAYNPAANADAKYKHLLKSVKSPNNAENNAENNVTAYQYFLNATATPRVQQISMPEGIVNSFDYTVGANSSVISRTTFTDGRGNPTVYDLDEHSRISSITAPRGAATRLEWSDFGQVTKTIDPEGKTTTVVFDANQNPQTQTVTGGNETIATTTLFDAKFSKMQSFTDGNGNRTTYSINQTNGNVDDVTLPNGRTVIFHYLTKGELKDVTDQFGTLTEFSDYDAYGNPQTITKHPGGENQVITQTFDIRSRMRSASDNLGIAQTVEYDALDRPVKRTASDPANYRNTLTTETLYLPEGQPSEIVQYDGTTQLLNKTANKYDKLQRLKETKETVGGYAQPFVRSFGYDKNSNLVSEQNRRGITTEKSYDALNYLSKIVEGGKTVWEAAEIDRVGNPKTVKDLFGNVTQYEYDGLERLTRKLLPESTQERLEYDRSNNITDSYDRNGKKTHYTFDALNRPETVTDAIGRITKTTYADASHEVKKEIVNRGLTETVKMDGLERPVSRKVQFAGTVYETKYAYDGRNVTMTDPRNVQTVRKLSGFGETGEVSVTGANPAYRVQMYYTALGAVNKMIDANNRVETFENDGFNRRTAANYNGEFTESWKYDGEGLPLERRDKRGITSAMTYDELGRKRTTTVGAIRVADTAYQDAQSRETVTDADSHQSVFQYDGLRRVRQTTNADGKSKNYVYDGENLREESDYYDRRTKYVYDDVNRVREVFDRLNGHTLIAYSADDLTKRTTDRRGNTGTEVSDALGRVLNVGKNGKIGSFAYDGNNNRISQQDGLNNETTFVYDNLNRLTTINHANGLQTETMTYDAAGNVKTHFDGRGGVTENVRYDSLDRLEEVKDGAGDVTKFDYDGEGLLLSKTDARQNQTTYQYNPLGSLVQVKEPDQPAWTFAYDGAQNLISAVDPLSRTVGYEYDALDRLKKTTQPLGRTTAYTYDDNSNRKTTVDPKGQTTMLGYDALDRPETANYAGQISQQFFYDAEDNLKQVNETRGGQARTYKREYDERDRLTLAIDAFNKTIGFTYDEANNLKTLTDAANRTTSYAYDAKNQLDTVKVNNAQVADYDWTADGLLSKVSYAANSKREYAYDDADRVSQITNTTGANTESFAYGYDASSNRVSETKQANGQATKTLNYGYDKLDRLTQVKTTSPTVSQIDYTYDAVGNRKSEIGTDQSGNQINRQATFDDLNQLTKLTSGSLVEDFEYDNNGNLAKHKQNNIEVERYEYDTRDQLTKYTSAGTGATASFDYDFERKRTAKTSNNTTTNYTYAGSQVLNESQNNNLTASYTIGASEIIKSEFSSGENNYHFTDALGSVTSLANAAGTLTARNDYDAFGLQSSSSSTANSIGYTGQRLDNETGLMALGNGERYYSPSYARFIQQDSFAGMPQMPQSLNRFAYAHNNPNKHTDPSGHFIPLIAWGIALIVIAAVSTSTVERHAAHNLEGEEKGWAADDARRSWGAALGDGSGMTKVFNAAVGQDAYTGRDLGWKERAWQGTLGTIEVIGNATGLSGAVFKAGSLVINVARGGDELLNLGRGAWSSIKNFEPALADAKSVADAVRNPFQTARAGWEATKDGYQAAKSSVSQMFEGGAKQTARRAWEFTKERLNPFSGEGNSVSQKSIQSEPLSEFDEAAIYQEAEYSRSLDIKNAKPGNPSEFNQARTKIADYRGKGKGGNYGYLEGEIGSIKLNGDIVKSKPFNKSIQQIFDPIEVQGANGRIWIRDTDSEFQMLNDLATRLGATKGKTYEGIIGRLKIVSENPYCASCKGVIQQFNQMFPNVDLTLINGVK